jgi:biotin carboxylase
MPRPLTVLCVATYLKGEDFLRACRERGARVILLTADPLRDAAWPHEAIDRIETIPREASDERIRQAVESVGRQERIDRIVALDDFDVEVAAMLREHLRVPGMGQTTARYFRDKLAMRLRARFATLDVPEFVHALNHEAIAEWIGRVPPPWLMKPRSSAASTGITRLESPHDLWQALERAGEGQSDYVLETFVSGDVYHVDSIVFRRRVLFAAAHKYGRPPLEVAHQGGIFVTRRLPDAGEEGSALLALNQRLLDAFNLERGVSHTEFIRGGDGRWYFLETSARVGGAYIANVVEAATGINLWREWAALELAGEGGDYAPPVPREEYAGIVLTLARQQEPDLSAYSDPEIVYRVRKAYHAGLIVASPDAARVESLVSSYTTRFLREFYTSAPAPERPTH